MCKNPPLAGTCDDGDACTADTCDVTGCQHVGQGCDDGNPCTQDACKAGTCSHLAMAGACDDGDLCTNGDTCAQGGCTGVAKACDDANPCTADACQKGLCQHEPQSGACDDGDACTAGDYCALGLCLAGATRNCDDGLDCTDDSCADGKCVHTGDTQAPQKTCVGEWLVEVYDECGGGPTLQECAPELPCAGGQCGGTAAVADAHLTGEGAAGATDTAGPGDPLTDSGAGAPPTTPGGSGHVGRDRLPGAARRQRLRLVGGSVAGPGRMSRRSGTAARRLTVGSPPRPAGRLSIAPRRHGFASRWRAAGRRAGCCPPPVPGAATLRGELAGVRRRRAAGRRRLRRAYGHGTWPSRLVFWPATT